MTVLTISSPADARRPLVLGYVAAFGAVLISGIYPAVTRVSITSTLTPADILMLRLGIPGLLFAVYLAWRFNEIPRRIWMLGVPLSFVHGWGMAGCVLLGLQFAPASHASALGPGGISAWIALIAALVYGRTISQAKLVSIGTILLGVVIILSASLGGLSLATALSGDAFFIMASVLGAAYLVYAQETKLDPALGVALVSTFSAVIVLPWYLTAAPSMIASAPLREILFQCVFQGILMGCVAFFAIGYAISTIGSQTFGVLNALVPVVGTVATFAIGGDPVAPIEGLAVAIIALGVAIGARPPRFGLQSTPSRIRP